MTAREPMLTEIIDEMEKKYARAGREITLVGKGKLDDHASDVINSLWNLAGQGIVLAKKLKELRVRVEKEIGYTETINISGSRKSKGLTGRIAGLRWVRDEIDASLRKGAD